jgi:hypothetical protein
MGVLHDNNISCPRPYSFAKLLFCARCQNASGRRSVSYSTWSIGDIDAANAQLIAAQQNFQNTDQFKVHLSQVKCIDQDSEGHNIWAACNVAAEPSNTDSLYQLFCDVQPGFQNATGTDEALQIYEAQKQAVITWVGFRSVIVLNKLPKAPV